MVFFTNPTKHPEDVGRVQLRRRFSYLDFGAGGASNMLPMGAIEKGGVPVDGSIIASVGVAGGTPKVDVGTSGSATAFGTGAGAAATPVALAGASLGIPVTADTVVYVRLNTSASAGDFEVMLSYISNRAAAAGIRNNPPGVSF